MGAGGLPAALDFLDDIFERFEKGGAISFREARVMALDLTGFAQLLLQLAHGEGHADIVIIKGFAGGAEDMAGSFQRAAGEGNITGDDDVTLLHHLDDAVIRLIRPLGDDDPLDERMIIQPHPRVGDEYDGQAVANGDLYSLVFNRAGVSVDQDFGQR